MIRKLVIEIDSGEKECAVCAWWDLESGELGFYAECLLFGGVIENDKRLPDCRRAEMKWEKRNGR